MGRVPYRLKNKNYLALNYKVVRIAKTQTGKWLFSSTTFPQRVGDQKNQEGPISLIQGELVFMENSIRFTS